MMLHRRLIEGGATGFVAYIPLIICVFAAIRLAKFNVDERQSENFLGLATPACALWCGSLIYAADHGVMSFAMMLHDTHIIPIASIVLALLMVSEIPMFSLKFKNLSWKDNKVSYIFLLVCIPLLVIFRISGFAAIILWYILWSLLTKKRA
jgi:CDP-diacylglycerol--serine O-phosphatidyltransferase